ncbi:uncharacterized protein F5891DRAFT_957189 [Suillus fuscotomentosus]|uniref:Uncharacterized protein n=2 Tax=Suillus fuscotomentosus TaxID=1912939 RepID=A0AAD4E0K0_9AGAM|nr:uncharacterized protein F5891DRAFT_957189 [Suillus fuscotomentosus]KAG1897505.1 hypothetical protein F5891DRAFT_957189 [Suillus fuscotomentosus]
MSPNPSQNSPWPAQTAPPSSSYSSSKRNRPDIGSSWSSSLGRRQGTIISNESALADAETQCEIYADNSQVTCYPNAGNLVIQHQWAPVVWNSRRPQISQFNIVQLYLFDADTNSPILNFTQQNPTTSAGEMNAEVNDTWFGSKGTSWTPGQNFSYPFYWVVTNQNGLDNGTYTTNPTFLAIQTTYADAVVSSMQSSSSAAAASSSAAAASSSAAALSSASLSHASGTSSLPSGNVQSNNSSPPFPHWAIAVIVVLGFLAIVAGGVLIWLIVRRLRRRGQLSNRGSIGSSSPMMANAQNSNSPQLPLLGAGIAGAVAGRTSSEQHRPASIVSPDGASDISRAHSAGDTGPFSGADAAIMADAFRKALRKPDFAGPTVEEAEDHRDDAIMSRELAEEGRDIRSVSSSRGVKVETLSETGDTVQDH